MYEVIAYNHDTDDTAAANIRNMPYIFSRETEEDANKTAYLMRQCGYKNVEIQIVQIEKA